MSATTQEVNPIEQDIEEKCEEHINRLVSNVKNKDFDDFLEVLEKVGEVSGSYSLNNITLIMSQMPTARIVNGYNQWQDLGRQVKKGESGIKILAPKLYKACPECGNTKNYHEKSGCDDNTDYDKWSKKCFGFKPVTVFDISQTEEIEGEESFKLPEIETRGDNGEEVYDELEVIARGMVEEVRIVDDLPVNGLYKPDSEVIVLKKRDKAAMAGTLVHELAHHFVDNSGESYCESRNEIIVESISYTVCEELGLDSSDSEKYIKSWEGDGVSAEFLKDDMNFIVESSNKIFERM